MQKNSKHYGTMNIKDLKLLSGLISSFTCYMDGQGGDIEKIRSFPLDELGLDISDVESAKASTELIERARNALSLFDRQVLSRCLSHMREKTELCAMQRGQLRSIQDLPNEVLAMVAEQVYISQGQKKSIKFSHVCRRWRNVALSLPGIWCTLTLYNPKLTQLLLARSKDAPLDLRILRVSEEEFEARTADFLANFTPQSKRCRSFALALDGDLDIDGIMQYMEGISLMCGHLDAPILETLSIECNSFGDDSGPISTDERFHFYAGWGMPRLRTLEVTNFIPKQVFGQSLRSLRMEFSVDIGLVLWDIQPILDFLGSIPQLEELSIRIQGVGFFPIEPVPAPLVLETIKTLSLEIGIDEGIEGLNVLELLIKTIVTPNLIELTLIGDVSTWGDFQYWLHAVFSDTYEDRFINLERFNIKIARYKNEQIYIDDIFPWTPNLSHLSVKMLRCDEGAELWHDPNSAPIPPLRTVQLSDFRDGPNFVSHGVEQIASAIINGPHYDLLEKIEVIECPAFELRRKTVEKLVQEQKLVWKD